MDDSKSSQRGDAKDGPGRTNSADGRRNVTSSSLAAGAHGQKNSKKQVSDLASAFSDAEEPPRSSSSRGAARTLTRTIAKSASSKHSGDLADMVGLALATARHDRQVSDSTAGESLEDEDGGDANALVGQDDGRIQLVDLASGRQLKLLSGHTRRIEAIHADWKEKQAISVGGDGQVFVWDLAIGIGGALQAKGVSRSCIRALAADLTAGTGKALTGNDDGRLILWNLESRKAENIFNCHLGLITAISADFTRLRAVVAHGDHSLDLISLKDGARLKNIPVHHGMVTVLDVAWNKARAILGMEDGCIQLMDLRHATPEATFSGHRSSISVLEVQWKHARALSGGYDKTLRLWNLKKTECIRIIAGHVDALRTLSVDWDVGVALSTGWDGEMQLWEVADDAESQLQPVGGEVRAGGACVLSISEVADDGDDSGVED